jgi:histone-lysine N-methyltransferase SETMAR
VVVLYVDGARCGLSIYEIKHWLISLTRNRTHFLYMLYFEMDKTHIRYYILTRFKLNYTARQIHVELCNAWGEGYVSYTTVAEWVQRFKQGRTSLEDDARIGRPVTSVTDKNIEAVRLLIEDNPHISIRYLAFELGISYGTVFGIIHDTLKLKKLCARWVPHELTEQCKKERVEICRENLAKLESGQWRMCDIISGDETWIYHRSIGSKQSNMAWCTEDQAPATVVRRSQYDHKNMFVIFFRTTGPELIHMVEGGNSITGDYYKNNCLKYLFNNIKRKRPKSGLHGIKLHHDNARPHQSNDIKTYLHEQGVSVIRHPPYSPDLAPADFWLFGYLKRQLGSYSDPKSLKQAVTKELHAIPTDEYQKTFHRWIDRMRLCITNQGDYFEHLTR